MSKFKPFALGSLVGAALVYTGLQYHLVHAKDGMYLVPRAPQASLGLAYADIRNLTDAELAATPELARAMTAHSTRTMLADSNDPEAGLDSLINSGSNTLQDARNRITETADDWGEQLRDTVPRPPSNRDAPIWNPFAEDQESDGPGLQLPGDLFDSIEETTNEVGSISWGNDDKVASQLEDVSPFSDITEQVEQGRESFASKTRELATEFRQRTESLASDRQGVKPFDFAGDIQPTYRTNRITQPSPQPSATTAAGRIIPLLRDDQIQNSLGQRSREIYEQTRRRATEPLDDAINRAQSRARSVIDELVGPGNSTADELIDRAARAANPQRYQRGN